jgi:eukaryotic-like serine/threonine-protein kinase
MVGELLADRYELEELVGTGGMSSVFRAHDRLLDRKVALKILHQHYASDGEHVERFRREARAVAALSHPNIVTVIDRGAHDGRQFIVFEYVDGENLKRLIQRRGSVPIAFALELAIQITQGLSFAHQQGLVHRDVKPQNVLLNGDGRAKVTDFGIARSLDVQRGMTQTGTVLGTSDYIAPEQAQGQRVDECTDVYSLGAVLYELLTSEVPFPGENFVSVAMRHINEPPPSIRDRRAEVPQRVDDAVRKAMAKDPAHRFATMGQFRQELEACLADLQSAGTEVAPAVRPVPRRRRRISPWPAIVSIVALIAIGGIVAYVTLEGFPSVSHGGGGGGSTGAKIPLHATTAYDPYGDGHENDSAAHLATDGVASTAWQTEDYHSTFAALHKAGVGLVLDAGAPVRIHRLEVTTTTPGFTAVVEAGDSPGGPFQAVSASQTTARLTTFAITDGGSFRYYVLWITALPPPGTGSAAVDEVVAR